MADDRGLSSTPSPLGGAALRQAQRREQRLFSGPPPSLPESGPSLWTQFSGMPNQPGSPTSLHEWLQTVDDAIVSAEVASESRAFPSSPSHAASSGNGSMDSFSVADFLGSGVCQERRLSSPACQDRMMNSSKPSMGQRFTFSSGLESSPDFGSPADFGSLHSSQYIQPPLDSMSSLSADMSGLPPADFIHPEPDFSFQTPLPDFPHPPSSYLPDLPPLNPAEPLHQNFRDYLAASGYSCKEAGVCEGQLGSTLPAFDAPTLSGQAVPTQHSSLPGHVKVSVPSPTFTSFSTIADGILFQDPADVSPSGQMEAPSFDTVTTPVQKKIQRQNSEPLYSRTAADEGKAIYVDALRRLNSFGPSYEPFGSAVQAHNADTPPTYVDKLPASDCKQAKPKEPVRKEPSKLSYSDVAKTFKGKASHSQTEAHGNEKMESENSSKVSAESPAHPKSHRHPTTRRVLSHTRIINQRSKPSFLEDSSHSSTYMLPNSRYGLDQFEDLSDLVRTEQCSSSMENLNSQLHHGGFEPNSNSSISSGTIPVGENRGPQVPPACGEDCLGSLYSKRVYNNANHVSTSGQTPDKCTASPTAPAAKNETLFFDPKRIFQSKSGGSSREPAANLTDKNKSCEERGRGNRESKEETVLNNGKPNNTSGKASAATHHRKTDYINNDLREGSSSSATSSGSGSGSKRTNQTLASSRHGHSSRKNSSKDSLPQNGSGADRSRGGAGRGRRQEPENEDDNSFIRNIDWVLVDEWMKYIWDCSMTFARNSFSAVLTLLVYLLGIIMYLTMGAIHLIAVGVSKLWTMVKSRLLKDQTGRSWSGFTTATENSRKRLGVEENITLPATGEEAMKRLLACKGKDPYSILGLRADASDEEIKRYYRRQAVLVHPDKNQEPGAEEAFKILGHAFEMIGEPTKRREYDAHILEASEAEAAMKEFSDLLTKLQEKVQEATNMMRCDHCGGKHRRIPVDRAWYSARYCDRCNIHHSAKEGDVWAESSMLGFLWHYYACMDNSIYDITEWVSCQRDHFKHMKANAHPVFYRIQTDSSRRHRQGQSGEADLEDFINRLFNKSSMSPEGTAHSGWQFPSQQGAPSSSQASSWGPSASSSSSSSSKRSRRKKKRN